MEKTKTFTLFFNLWVAAVVVNSVSHAAGIRGKGLFLILAIYVVILTVPIHYFAFGEFWHQAYNNNEEYQKYSSINQVIALILLIILLVPLNQLALESRKKNWNRLSHNCMLEIKSEKNC